MRNPVRADKWEAVFGEAAAKRFALQQSAARRFHIAAPMFHYVATSLLQPEDFRHWLRLEDDGVTTACQRVVVEETELCRLDEERRQRSERSGEWSAPKF